MGARKTPKVKGASKGKRWKKGQSSSSNPTLTKFRDAARSGFFHVLPAGRDESKLTVAALSIHDADGISLESSSRGRSRLLSTETSSDMELAEASQTITSAGGTSVKSFASDFTDCTNLSFGRLMMNFRPDSIIQKEMVAVLAAVTEIIRCEGGQESETEYFAALMTALESSFREPRSEEEEGKATTTLAAILGLVAMCIKGVPKNVLALKFKQSSELLCDILTKEMEQNSQERTGIVKPIIACLFPLLKSIDESSWKNEGSEVSRGFRGLLSLSLHPKPKIRKLAQHAVIGILRASSFMLTANPPPVHPGASEVGKYLVQRLEDAMNDSAPQLSEQREENSLETAEAESTKSKKEKKKKSRKATSTSQSHLLKILSFLKEVISFLPQTHVRKLSEYLLTLSSAHAPLLRSHSLHALHALLSSHPGPSVMSARTAGQILSALFDLKPSEADVVLLANWTQALQEGILALYTLNREAGLSAVTRFFKTVFPLFQVSRPTGGSGEGALHSVTAQALAAVLRGVVAKEIDVLREQHEAEGGESTLQTIQQTISSGLSYLFHKSWNHVLQVTAVFIEVTGASVPSFSLAVIATLAPVRARNPQFSSEIELVFASALKSLGPRLVLKVLPLLLPSGQVNESSLWLVPLLPRFVAKGDLGTFKEDLVPVALTAQAQSENAELKESQQKQFAVLERQIWDCFPAFCQNPADADKYKSMAKQIGTLIESRPDIRSCLLSGLRNLCRSCPELMQKYARNYLGILFETLTKEQGTKRSGLNQTIQLYLEKATQPDLPPVLLQKALEKYRSTESQALKESYLALVRLLIPFVQKQDIQEVFQLIKELLRDGEKRAQKKAYHVLSAILDSGSDGARDFVGKEEASLLELLTSALSTSSPITKKFRLRCLSRLLRGGKRSLGEDDDQLRVLLGEAVLCTKDSNSKAREAAFELLLEIGKAMHDDDQGPDETLRRYFSLLLAGLAGNPPLVASTVLAIAHIMHHTRSCFPPDLLELLVRNISLLATSPSREIVASCLAFFKSVLSSFDKRTVNSHLRALVSAICEMTPDCKRHFRIKTRNLLTILVRRYGYEVISTLVPGTDEVLLKCLRNIRKANSRKSRAQPSVDEDENTEKDNRIVPVVKQAKSVEQILAEVDADSDDEDDLEDDDDTRKKSSRKKLVAGRRKGKKSTWIQEDGDAVDLMDPGSVRNISASKPLLLLGQSKSKGSVNPFKTMPDGRLLITEDKDDDSSGGDDSDSEVEFRDSVSMISDKMKNLGHAGPVLGKRKMDSSSSSAAGSRTSLYEAGGSGIHRPLSGNMGPPKKRRWNESLRTQSAGGQMGAEFKAKKGKGDVKKKGAKFDPFAYVPLKKEALNRRKQSKFSGQFKGLVKGARKGATDGIRKRKKQKAKR